MAHQLVSQKTWFSSNADAEAETVALCQAVKHEGLPTLILFDALLAGARRPVELVGKVDNTQATTAVHNGYSKKLKILERTHKCSIGLLMSSSSLDDSALNILERSRTEDMVSQNV